MMFPVALLSFATACGPSSPGARSVADASRIIEASFRTESANLTAGPVLITTRLNLCPCDQNLIYEARIYGSWRHVYIVGNNSGLADVESAAARVPDGASFEFSYKLDSNLYTSVTGQQYYMLRLP